MHITEFGAPIHSHLQSAAAVAPAAAVVVLPLQGVQGSAAVDAGTLLYVPESNTVNTSTGKKPIDTVMSRDWVRCRGDLLRQLYPCCQKARCAMPCHAVLWSCCVVPSLHQSSPSPIGHNPVTPYPTSGLQSAKLLPTPGPAVVVPTGQGWQVKMLSPQLYDPASQRCAILPL